MTKPAVLFPALLAIVSAVTGCGSPSGPSPIPAPALPQPWSYRDPATGISTADLVDVDGDILHFNVAGEFVWVATGARFPGYTGGGGTVYIYDKTVAIEVVFGTKDGRRRAFLTLLSDGREEWGPGYLADGTLMDGELLFKSTTVPPPGR